MYISTPHYTGPSSPPMRNKKLTIDKKPELEEELEKKISFSLSMKDILLISLLVILITYLYCKIKK